MKTPFVPDPGPYYNVEADVFSQQTKKKLAHCYGDHAHDTAKLLASVHRLIAVLEMLEHMESRDVRDDVSNVNAAYKLGLIYGALKNAGIDSGDPRR